MVVAGVGCGPPGPAPRGPVCQIRELDRAFPRATAVCTTILAINPRTISPMSIRVMLMIRASSLVGAMSPKPTVEKMVTVR